MSVQQIHAFLVHPEKGRQSKSELTGTDVPLSGKMFELLNAIYERSERECDIDICFRSKTGEQENAFRDILISYLRSKNLEAARVIAERLRDNTDGRSGLGLLFVICGVVGSYNKIIISRFPTDSAIFVNEDEKSLTVEFLERVFMKNKTSYKAAAYVDDSLDSGFWDGRAIDKQVNDRGGQVSDYWISDFLLSDFRTTPAQGSKRLGKALKDAVKGAPLGVKEELVAMGKLLEGFAGKLISIDSLVDQFGLSDAAKEALVGELKNPVTAKEQFRLDIGNFRNYVAFRSVELDNGGMLTAGLAEFDDVFKQKKIDESDDTVEFSTRGRILNAKLRATR